MASTRHIEHKQTLTLIQTITNSNIKIYPITKKKTTFMFELQFISRITSEKKLKENKSHQPLRNSQNRRGKLLSQLEILLLRKVKY